MRATVCEKQRTHGVVSDEELEDWSCVKFTNKKNLKIYFTFQ